MSERTRTIADVEQLEALLATPSAALIEDLKSLDGDLMLLGAGGKMGPSMAMLARNAAPEQAAERLQQQAQPWWWLYR